MLFSSRSPYPRAVGVLFAPLIDSPYYTFHPSLVMQEACKQFYSTRENVCLFPWIQTQARIVPYSAARDSKTLLAVHNEFYE